MKTILIYTKDVKSNGKTFTIVKGILKGKHYVDVVLWADALENLSRDMKEQKLAYPVEIGLNEDDYYFKKKTTAKDGKTFVNYKIYIKNYHDLKQGSYPHNRTLDDIISDLESDED